MMGRWSVILSWGGEGMQGIICWGGWMRGGGVLYCHGCVKEGRVYLGWLGGKVKCYTGMGGW